VITTFQVLASEYNINQVPVNVAKVASESDSDSDAPKKKGKSKGKKNATMVSPLFDIKWLRIVIGEEDCLIQLTPRRSAEH
jgi:hypothetical protein